MFKAKIEGGKEAEYLIMDPRNHSTTLQLIVNVV